MVLLQPVTLTDFMDYMVYVQQQAEDLQFFLWLQDFENRFEQLPADSKTLSPIWAESADISRVDAVNPADISVQRDKAILPTAESRLHICN